MKVEVIKCDQCGTIKGESNGWTRAILLENASGSCSITFPLLAEGESLRGPTIDHARFSAIDLCGVGCAHRYLDSKIFAGHQSAGAPAEERALTHDD